MRHSTLDFSTQTQIPSSLEKAVQHVAVEASARVQTQIEMKDLAVEVETKEPFVV